MAGYVDPALLNTFLAEFPEEDPRCSIRIRINGKFVKLRSGKSRWATTGHAKSALKEHCKVGKVVDLVEGTGYPKDRNKKWSDFISELEAMKILEFVKS